MGKQNQNILQTYFKAFKLMKIDNRLIIEIFYEMYVNRIDDLTFQRM